MFDVFISYARSSEAETQRIAQALHALGYDVWRDRDLPPHRAYTEVIEERLRSAKAVVVVWTADAAKSEWVRAEAEVARATRKLVQLSLDGVAPPLPFNQTQCADLRDWTGEDHHPGWRKIVTSIAELTHDQATETAPAPIYGADVGAGTTSGLPMTPAGPPSCAQRCSICVLPFANMSGDIEQEYFSDGISEDIITDLSKVSALEVSARHTSFQFKGKSVDIQQVARQLKVSHVLEGSVRKARGRVRITAQLIDGSSGKHVWAERYDRDLNDIFALQDEISEAIVTALKFKLLPEEKNAIERRGTHSVEAYNLYLMARQYFITGNHGDVRHGEATIRLCGRATELDPSYARAWALMAVGQAQLRTLFGGIGDGGLAAADQALALDPHLANAHAVRAEILWKNGHQEEASAEIVTALRLDPESYEVNAVAADLSFRKQRPEDAIRYLEKATALIDTNFYSPSMLAACYRAVGDLEAARRAAQITLARVEKVMAQDRNNGSAMGHGVGALAILGQSERAKEWIDRGLLIDPDNVTMRYNFGSALADRLNDPDAALDMLGPVLAKATLVFLNHAKVDPDLDRLRDNPRFKVMIADAEARLAAEREAVSSQAS